MGFWVAFGVGVGVGEAVGVGVGLGEGVGDGVGETVGDASGEGEGAVVSCTVWGVGAGSTGSWGAEAHPANSPASSRGSTAARKKWRFMNKPRFLRAG